MPLTDIKVRSANKAEKSSLMNGLLNSLIFRKNDRFKSEHEVFP